MGDETGANTMNLDLNLGPLVPSSPGRELGSDSDLVLGESTSLDNWLQEPPLRRRLSAAIRIRSRQRWRRQQVHMPPETQNMSMELMGNPGDVSVSHAGEGSAAAAAAAAAAEGRAGEVAKTCENNNGDLGDEALGKKEHVEKGCSGDGSFFDCNICLDLASDPVVTCCGHLFCWACLYRWLHIHSDAKECPVCKGEVTIKNLTPIYGRGSITRVPMEDLGAEIPLRPQARRIESWRQSISRNPVHSTMEEMFRRFGSRHNLARDVVLPQDLDTSDNVDDTLERNHPFLHYLVARRMRRDPNMVAPPDDVVDLTQNSDNNLGLGSLLLRRSQPHRPVPASFSFQATLMPPDRPGDAYFRSHPAGRINDPPPADDRDSFSSIGAVIHSGSQTVDTAVEIDSTVSHSTLSSRRRNDVSRASDVDSGDSRAPRRRRLN